MTKEEFKARVYEALHTSEHWEQFLECVGQLYLQATPHWISVEDELPPIGWTMSDSVLVTDGKVMKIAWYHQDEGWLFATELKFEPTHWMPLPEQPAKLSNLERTGKNEL